MAVRSTWIIRQCRTEHSEDESTHEPGGAWPSAAPPEEREAYPAEARAPTTPNCFEQVWSYVEVGTAHERDSYWIRCYRPSSCERPFEPGELLDGPVPHPARGGRRAAWASFTKPSTRRLEKRDRTQVRQGRDSARRLPPEVRNARRNQPIPMSVRSSRFTPPPLIAGRHRLPDHGIS